MLLGKTQLSRHVRRIVSRGASRRSIKQAQSRAILGPGPRMIAAARTLLKSVNDNKYAHIPNIDPKKGIFHGDCSDLLNFLFAKLNPKAFAALPTDAITRQPRSRNYYAFLEQLPVVGSTNAKTGWVRVARPSELRPGDVVAWKNPAYKPGANSTGHVMLVSEPPVPVRREGRVVGFELPVIDSTSHGHGVADIRKKGGQTGLGQGVVFFPTNEQGVATAFSWEPFRESSTAALRPPVIAFGRLLK